MFLLISIAANINKPHTILISPFFFIICLSIKIAMQLLLISFSLIDRYQVASLIIDVDRVLMHYKNGSRNLSSLFTVIFIGSTEVNKEVTLDGDAIKKVAKFSYL